MNDAPLWLQSLSLVVNTLNRYSYSYGDFYTNGVSLQSEIEADDDIPLAFNDLPDLKAVRLEGGTGRYDSIAEKVCLARVVDKV